MVTHNCIEGPYLLIFYFSKGFIKIWYYFFLLQSICKITGFFPSSIVHYNKDAETLILCGLMCDKQFPNITFINLTKCLFCKICS